MNSKNASALVLVALAVISSAGGVRRGAADSCDALPGIAGSWIAERAFAPRTISGSLALAVDTNGNPHAAYGGEHLFHAYRDGGGWHYEVADSRQGAGTLAAIALDAANHAHIVYHDSSSSAVRYATNASGAWATQLVAQGVNFMAVAIALDPAGKPRVVYQDVAADETRYATSATGTWTTTRIDAAGQSCSIVVDAGGKNHIGYGLGSFVSQSPRSMRYATDASGSWKTQSVDDSGNEDGYYNDIALDSQGKVHVVYAHTDGSVRVVRHATNASGQWVRDDLTFPQLNQVASLAIDASDAVHVSSGAGTKLVYFTNASGSFVAEEVGDGSGPSSIVARAGGLSILHRHGSVLRLTEGASHSWTSSVVDATSDPGMGVSLRLDSADKAYITQVNTTGIGGTPHAEVGFTTNASGQWTTETLDSAAFGIRFTSLVVDAAAHAHVAYLQQDSVRHVRYATNASGSWVFEDVVTASAAGPALALDSQARPRIAFADNQVRYATRNGAVWTTEVVDASTRASLRVELALDGNDHAHIVYSDASGPSVYHATNATGSWVRTTIGTWFDSPTGGGAGWGSPAIAVDAANRSHVVWSRERGADSDVVYATDASGSWTATNLGPGTMYSSITADAEGHAHIATSCFGKLRHLTNASGVWRSAVVDSGADGPRRFTADVFAADEGAGSGVVSVEPSGLGLVGVFSSIRIASDGLPRFAYADGFQGDVKFARPDDGAGALAITVECTASAGSASASDFSAVARTLGWSADDTGTKTFAVPLTDDTVLEGSETITMTLSNPTGTPTLGPRATATLVIRDDDFPRGAVGANFLPRAVAVKVAGVKSRLTASGFFDTGATVPLFSGPATLTIGGLTVSIPSTVKTVKGVFRHKTTDGIDFSVKPSKFGSSRGVFKLVISNRDLAGLVDPNAPITLRYDDVAIDGTGQVGLTNGKYKLGAVRGTLLAPLVHLKKISAKVLGDGKDSFTLDAGVGGLGDAPGAAPDVRVSLGAYSVTIPGGDFKKSGGKFTFKGGKTGVASAALDYDRETLQVAVKAVDLGAFAQGAQPVIVTLQVGVATRTAVIRMARSGVSLKY